MRSSQDPARKQAREKMLKWRARRELNPGPPGLLRTGKSLTESLSPVLYLFRTLSRRI